MSHFSDVGTMRVIELDKQSPNEKENDHESKKQFFDPGSRNHSTR